MSRPPVSEAEARRLIERIVRENGFVSESSLESMSQEVRREVEEALLAKDKKIGSSVLTLAKNLYTSKARFVFELLQNTDDNNYATAQAAGQDPFVSFNLYPDKLIVDCNEDGFTGKNLSAICNIGNSSKSSHQGYIGEKGIGFKSVFMAAYKVHIQSGHLSFSFVHRKGDSGMGMIKPKWEDPAGELPQANYTRITLFLQDSGDAEQTQRERDDIRHQFRELEPALLLFVQKLRCVEVTFRDEQGRQMWATRFKRRPVAEANRAVLERRTADEGRVYDADPETHIYHVTNHVATNVARHDNRELPSSQHDSPLSRRSNIVLAFPITAESVPLIEIQKVFAFLPMKQMGFNFLIQADFVTQANREDVVTTSARNQDLIQGVVDAFIATIHQFCQHGSLQYTWMRYLPCQGTHHWDPFWTKLVDGIRQRLEHEPVIRTREKRVLRRISDMKDRGRYLDDQHGKPLLPDLDPEIYLSDSYAGTDIEVLTSFGLKNIHLGHIRACLERDLAQPGTASRMRSPSTDNNWHSRLCSLLLVSFENGRASDKDGLMKLPIIPLQNGSWVRAVDGEIFYGAIGKIQVPGDLGLQVVAAKAAENPKRRELFDNLGVRSASTKKVRSHILDMYSRGDMAEVALENSLEHLKFLYITHQSRPKNEEPLDMVILNNFDEPLDPHAFDMYIWDDHPYGPRNLLDLRVMSSQEAFFINPRYLKRPPKTPSGMELSWVEWLHEEVGIRRNIRIAKSNGTGLSWACKHIAEHHSDKFLGFLKHVWPDEGCCVMENANVLAELKKIPVPCTNGARAPLSTCYMPRQKLRSAQSRFSNTEIMPFLDITSSSDADLLSQWSFLTDIVGVTWEDDLGFRLNLLTACVDSAPESLTKASALKFFDLYGYIAACCMGSDSPEVAKNLVRSYFKPSGLILCPSHDMGLDDIEWDLPQYSLWEAPLAMESMTPFKALYEKAGLGPDLYGMQHFCQEVLGIPDVGHMHIIEELKYILESGDERDVGSLYDLLQEMVDEDNSISGDIRDAFEEHSLVYAERAGSSGWYRPSQCLWASTTNIDGKVAISGQYAHLEWFFAEVLRVQRENLSLVHDALLTEASNGATPVQIKQLLLNLSSHLQREQDRPQPNRVLQRRVFPVTSPGEGGVALFSKDTEFCIVDREDLFAAFAGRVKCLDFTLKEVCHLRPFIAWAGLESRYLSRCVEEVSRVQGGVERPIRDPTRDVKRKAYALLRIAAKYGSPRYQADPQALYDTLRTAETVEAAGISSTLVLRQDGYTHEHELSKSELHIEERDGRLKIYVPQDEKAFAACVCNTLPRRLLSWIMASPGSTGAHTSVVDGAVAVTISILTCRPAGLDTILESNGVPSVDEVIEVPEPVAEVPSPPETPDRRNEYQGRSPGEASSAAVTPERLFLSPDYYDASYATPLTDPGIYESDSDGYGTIPSPVRLWPGGSNEFKEAYARLLDSAVVAAERMALREYGVEDIADVLDNLSLDDDDVFTSSPSTHDLSLIRGRFHEIGAAGELFVFVLLSSLEPSLPLFGRDNWQSTIRFHAAAHPRFAGMANWVGRETSDIVYDDASGVLTDLLMAKGHLSQEWTGKSPRYYIEVKSTLGSCETPFIVSHNQVERMRTTTNGPSGCDNQDAVYVVFRVFNLGRESAGLKIYVDPEEQRRTGRLRFETDATRVTPGPSSWAGAH